MEPPSPREYAAGAAILVGAVWFAVQPLVPDADVGRSDVDRMIQHVDHLAQEPHPMGSEAGVAVRDYLLGRLEESGVEAVAQTVSAPDYFGSPGATVEISNVIGRVPGLGEGAASLLVAHYDTVLWTAGANDNSAPVAALLDVARVLASDPPRRDVIVLFTDGEEPTPRFGASAFVEHEWFAEVATVVNFEGIGAGGPLMLVGVNGPEASLIGFLSEWRERPVAYSFLTWTADQLGGASTDFDVFRTVGTPGYNLAYLRGPSIYHTDRDDVSNLNVGGMAHVAAVAQAVARAGEAPDSATAGSPVAFFSIPGGDVVRYGRGPGLVAGLALIALAALEVATAVRRGDTSAAGVRRGFGYAVGGILAAVAVFAAAWVAIVAVRADMSLGESVGWLVGFTAGIVGAWPGFSSWARRRGGDVASGMLLLWVLLAAATSMWAFPVSYLFVWPALAGTAALAAVRAWAERPGRLLGFLAVAVVGCVLVVPAVDTFFQLATPRPGNPDSELAAAVVVPVALLALLTGLLHATFTGAGSRSGT